MNVYWSVESLRSLKAIEEYLLEADSPQTARRLLKRLVDRGDQLKTAPTSGRRLPEYPDYELRELLERPYRLIYQCKADRIEIITVKHYRQRLPQRPSRLKS